ncbi:MAG: radical SAM protein [Oscillospiraceae bacterium]|nr:radical SAM protein [Oscillospiraceae bacterium]
MHNTAPKKLIAVNVPIQACNLKCHYCYISQLNEWERNNSECKLQPELIGQALSSERLGGPCIINLTGKGETLIPKEMTNIIGILLKQGHYLEVVTNGTLTNRFQEIAQLPVEYLSRLEFKFSFHYLELKERQWIDRFFDNVRMMRQAGCSFTIELMPNDELVPHIDDIKRICIEKVGALCHLTIGRDDNNGRKILTKMPIDEYLRIWGQFESNMFNFKYSVFDVKRAEFCYAGSWSLYVNLLTGEARQCYGCLPNQNIYKDVSKPIKFRPIGKHCKQPFCYNAHAFMSLGVIPKIETPTYADIRDRVDNEGNHWLSDDIQKAFSTKLSNTNTKIEGIDKIKFYLDYPWHCVNILKTNKDKLMKRFKKNG